MTDLLTRAADTGWLPFIAAAGAYAFKRLVDVILPPGHTLKLTRRFLRRINGPPGGED